MQGMISNGLLRRKLEMNCYIKKVKNKLFSKGQTSFKCQIFPADFKHGNVCFSESKTVFVLLAKQRHSLAAEIKK